ncbi:MAG: right-handed parallel beta-helix repeat-containing protein [Myxococcales bacterium]|nr:right-handed parallel beta-helix repeat-containing protein [Myxococcales bacterium]
MRHLVWLLPLAACTGDDTDTTDTDVATDTTTEETGDTGTAADEPLTCADVARTNCMEIAAGDSQALLDAVNTLGDDSAIVLGEGTYTLDNQVTVRAEGFTLMGQGIDKSILDFSPVQVQVNGVDMVGDDVHVEGLTILEAPKDGLRIENSDGVVIRRVKVSWANESDSTNGAYGIYPVKVSRVLMEDSEAYNASDAGIYVGQCQHAIVRNNVAMGNVAGMEIENTQFADVYGNRAEDNTAGLVVFDLPGNPVVGRDVRIHDNVIINNNRKNFAPGGTVREIPAGTGTFAMASRRVEIDNNRYENNGTSDIAVISGLTVDSNPSSWYLKESALVGDTSGFAKEMRVDDEGFANYRSYDIYIHDNTHKGSGLDPDGALVNGLPGFGSLLKEIYTDRDNDVLRPVDELLYDALGETGHDPAAEKGNSNDNRICIADNAGATFASLVLATQPDFDGLYRPDAPFAPFNCVGSTPAAPNMDAE